MIKEFIFVASHRDIQVVHIGIFPSLGRYFRKQMTYRGGGIFRTEIEIPRGEVYYHYFLNEDFNHPQGNILEELAAKDDPLNRSSLFLGTKPFCALEFNTGPQYLSRDSQGNLTLRAITHYTHIESLVLIMDETEEIPFFPLFRFQNETYWWLKFPIRERMDTFAIKLKIRRGEIILYRDAFPDTAMMKAEINKRTISPASVGYQVFPDRFFKSKKQEDRDFFLPWGAPPKLFSYFGGDIPGISKKLPYLKALGINFIYLNPIFYSGSSHRYDTIDYYQVDPLLGSSDEFKELVEKAHSLKIGIILDLALNHCGVDFFAFKDVLENQELSRYRNWFSINRYPVQVNEKPAYDCYQGHTHMPEFNLENPEVREYLRRAVLYWLKNYDIDGFRIDTCASIKLDFLQELVKNIREIKPGAFLVGEYWHSNAFDILEKTGIDAITNYTIYWKGLRMLLEKGARQIGKAAALIMSWYYRYTHEQTHYCWNFLGNHDLPRLISVMHDKRQYKMAIALLYALPGIPLIYYGEEIALQGMNDPDNRRCMDWAEADFNNPGNPGTPLIMQCYQWLNKLRRKYSAIFGEGCIAIPYLDENNKILVLQRFTGEEALYFIFNFGEKKVTVNFSEFSKAYKFELKSLSFDCEHSLELETHICVDSSEVKFIYGRSHEGL